MKITQDHIILEAKKMGLSEDRIQRIIHPHLPSSSSIEDNINSFGVDTEAFDLLDIETSVISPKHPDIFYLISPLIQANLPHSKPDSNEYSRSNGLLNIKILAPHDPGLPYGIPPRLLLMHIFSYSKKRKCQDVYLGSGIREILKYLGVTPTTGKRGSVKAYSEQLLRLCSTFFTLTLESRNDIQHIKKIDIQNSPLFEKASLWWDDDYDNEGGFVRLSPKFYDAVQESAVPLDSQAIKKLQSSSMALDIYCWLTYRLCRLNKPAKASWQSLINQFGANYSLQKTFKQNFIAALKNVLAVYPDAKISYDAKGLLLKPSKAHVKQTKSISKNKVSV